MFAATEISPALGVASAAVVPMICTDGVFKLETNIILAIILSKSISGVSFFTGGLSDEKPNFSAIFARLSVISTGFLVRCLSDFRQFCTTTEGG